MRDRAVETGIREEFGVGRRGRRRGRFPYDGDNRRLVRRVGSRILSFGLPLLVIGRRLRTRYVR